MPEGQARKEQLEENIRVYERVIHNFERMRRQLMERRQNASDSVMLHIDRSLALNASTLKSLNAILTTTRAELAAYGKGAGRTDDVRTGERGR
jgi:hypothetical protein